MNNVTRATGHGWFSKKTAEKYGANIWNTPGGGTVIVTTVLSADAPYFFDDAICVGPVTTWKCISSVYPRK